jgi:predicted ATPase/ATP/maltotriose-dependent transcriptional regulator MalT
VAGELTWRVPPLSLPTDSHPSPEYSQRFEAIALFVTRARSAEPAFALTLANVGAVVELCRQLDGLPLAIELAAARMPVLGPQQLADRLNDRFRLLAVDHRRAPAHHHALRATLDWSFTLLSAQEGRLFERLAIFAGGFSLEAAEVVCSEDGIQACEVLALLGGLVEKSLVLAEPAPGTERRYRLLETVRQYAAERLASTNAELRIAERHLDWCLSMMERFEAEFRGPNQSVWFHRIEQERDNLFAALRRCIEHGAQERGLRLAGAAWRFWEVRGYLSDAREWLGRLLDLSTGVRTLARGKVLDAAGHLAILQGDQAAGLPLVEAGLALARELDDRVALANGFHSLGLAAQYRKDYPAAEAFHQRSLDLAQQAGDRARTYVALYNLAVVAQKQKYLEHAIELHEASLVLKRQAGDRWSIGYSLLNLGIVAWMRGDLDRAPQLVQEALRLRWELGDKPGIAACLETLAEIGASEGRARRAARLYGGADGLLQAIGVRILATRHDGGRGGLSAARSQLGEAVFTAAYNAGRSVPLERAVAEALASEHGTRSSGGGGPESVTTLTPREHEVAELVARGMSNRQIAFELTIADGTAARHVANILTRLGFRTRAEVAAWAVAEQLGKG